jgi:glycosyltransferase involved in cell wall biosynthesis
MPPLVSILIPAYNAERWIGEAIKSALDQTWPNKEIIVVDDGSRDGTLSVARQFDSKGVSIVSQSNQGASAARNRALNLAQGDYLQWLDADDLLAPDKVQKQMDIARETASKRTLFSSPWAHFFYRTSRAQFIPTELWSDLSPVEWLTRKMAHNCHMQTATWLVSRDLTEAAGPWDVRLWKDNDGEYFCRVVAATDAIRFVPEARTYYRRSDCNSVTNIGRSNRKMDSQFLSLQLHTHYLLSLQDTPRTRAACVSYLQTWFYNFYPQRRDIVDGLRKLATSMGGELQTPHLSWKYAWAQKIFGWGVAKELQLIARNQKERLLRFWDKILFEWERRFPRKLVNVANTSAGASF